MAHWVAQVLFCCEAVVKSPKWRIRGCIGRVCQTELGQQIVRWVLLNREVHSAMCQVIWFPWLGKRSFHQYGGIKELWFHKSNKLQVVLLFIWSLKRIRKKCYTVGKISSLSFVDEVDYLWLKGNLSPLRGELRNYKLVDCNLHRCVNEKKKNKGAVCKHAMQKMQNPVLYINKFSKLYAIYHKCGPTAVSLLFISGKQKLIFLL